MTSGRISVVCATEAYGLIARERAAFQALYPQATIGLKAGDSRDAVSALFAADCELAGVTRDLEPEERRAATLGGLGIEGYTFARDAVILVVNRSNRVENLSVEEVRRIYRGELVDWSRVGGAAGPIVPVMQPPSSDVAAYFGQQVMGGEPIEAHVAYQPSDSGVIARVSGDPNAIGFASLGSASPNARTLRVASLIGLPYWKPDLEAVYHGDYPLTRSFNLYVRASGPRLASGFITFVTSREGQQLVRDAGLVPTAVPVRFVRRSPMLSTH